MPIDLIELYEEFALRGIEPMPLDCVTPKTNFVAHWNDTARSVSLGCDEDPGDQTQGSGSFPGKLAPPALHQIC